MWNELTTRTMCLKAKSLSFVARSIQVTSSVQYFLVDLGYCGNNISFASVCNVINEPFGSSKNDIHWNSFSTPPFYHQTGNDTLTHRRSLLEIILMDALCFCVICYCFVTFFLHRCSALMVKSAKWESNHRNSLFRGPWRKCPWLRYWCYGSCSVFATDT